MPNLSLGGKPGQWACVALAAIVLASTGIPLLSRPNYEVIYDARTTGSGCYDTHCSKLFILQIGNTGWKNQSDVVVEVNSKWLEFAQPEAKAYSSGIILRPMEVETGENTAKWNLGALEPGKRVDVKFALVVPRNKQLPEWEDILVKVTPSQGNSYAGSPEWTTFSRFIAFFFK